MLRSPDYPVGDRPWAPARSHHRELHAWTSQPPASALIAELDLDSGRLRWVIAGHPPPLLLRQGRVVKELTRRPNAPLGLRLNDNFTVHKEALEPRDRLVLYSDGVVEAMDATTGERFGIERLVDFVARAEAVGEPVPETMRRLGHAVVKHQGDELQEVPFAGPSRTP